MKLKWQAPSVFQTMAGRIFILLAVGIAASSIVSLYFANKARHSDFQRIRLERVAASAVDVAGRLAREPEKTSQMLSDRLILGAAYAPVGVAIGDPEPELARLLARSLGPASHPEAGQVPAGFCFRYRRIDPRQAAAGYADAPHPDCWIVRFTDAGGARQAIALSLPRLSLPADSTFRPVDLILIMMVSALLAILVAHEVAKPLRRLENAAEAFSISLDPRLLPEEGPKEVRAALSTFNLMQNRVRAGFRERTQLLSAISHDLQTPLTRMRLRLEQVQDQNLREKLLQDHRAMQTLVREGLDLANSTEVQEDWAMIDIDSLLVSIAEDAAELGHKVRFIKGCGGMVRVKPNALTRCIGNLLDNAVKYGGDAELMCSRKEGHILISVRDHGPGIEEAELDKMFEPFTRGVAGQPGGRSGTGIGLTIARTLALTFDGAVQLSNAEGGGLVATISFDG